MDYREHPINRNITEEAKIGLLREMLRVRRFELTALKQYNAGRIGGFLPLGIGQESIPVGLRSLVGPDDHTICGWRGLGHALAAGVSMDACMAELYGKSGGCCQGKGGAMSLFSPANRFWGAYGLAASQTPIAAGLAFALKQGGKHGAVFCILGDGAVNQGVYHETLNLAGLFNLPVVFVIENNGYGMGTSVSRSSRYRECLARRAETYNIDWEKIGDGNLYELRARVDTALEKARKEHRPTVVEIPTYRYYGFHVADSRAKIYRSPEEIELMKSTRDPIILWRRRLLEEGILDDKIVQRLDEEARQEAKSAVAFAEASESPTRADIMTHVYWESDHGTPASKIGRHFFD